MFRAYPGDPVLPTTPTNRKEVDGLLAVSGEERLAPKLALRKCTANISTALRACFCEQCGLITRPLCPIHVFWEAVISSTAPGAPIPHPAER